MPLSFASLCSAKALEAGTVSFHLLASHNARISIRGHVHFSRPCYINPVFRLALFLNLEVVLAGKRLILDNLNPVSIGIKNKGDILHPAIREPLLPVDVQAFKASTRRIQVIDGNT